MNYTNKNIIWITVWQRVNTWTKQELFSVVLVCLQSSLCTILVPSLYLAGTCLFPEDGRSFIKVWLYFGSLLVWSPGSTLLIAEVFCFCISRYSTHYNKEEKPVEVMYTERLYPWKVVSFVFLKILFPSYSFRGQSRRLCILFFVQ